MTADETLPETDLRPYRAQIRDLARARARDLGVSFGSLVGPRGVIEQEIEERRPRIRRAAALAEALARAAGDEPIEPSTLRPKTIAGIAVLRARRVQLREVEELR